MLKIGLLLDSDSVTRCIWDFIETCQAQELIQITHAIIRKPEISPAQSGSTNDEHDDVPDQSQAWNNLRLLGYEKYLLRTPDQKAAFQLVDIDSAVPNVLSFDDHDETTRADLTGEHFDILLQLGTRPLTPTISQLARHGVLILADSNHTNLFDNPIGFWEVFHRESVTRFGVLKTTLNGELNELIFAGSTSTGYCYALNRIIVLNKALSQIQRLLLRLAAGQDLPASLKVVINRRHDVHPAINHQIQYIIKSGIFFLSLFWRHLILRKRYRWEVAIAAQPWTTFKPARSIRIPNPAFHFQADPFVIRESGIDYCLVEDLDYRSGRGVISAYQIGDQAITRLGEVLTESFHLSFPYLFRYQGKIYLCPESSENRDIRIYESVRFPTEWKLVQVALKDVSAVDTMIFERDGHWWMLTNIDSANVGDHASELHLFSAQQPLTDQWQPHPGNPVIFDAQRARNGGILCEGDQIFRVAQQNRFFQYGTGVTINRIDQLSETAYNETQVRLVEPDFFSPLTGNHPVEGNHHVHSNGHVTAFDFCRLRPARQRDQ